MEKDEVQRLFVQHYARMFRVARSILFDEQESEDVCSDIFESLLHGDFVLLPGTEEQYLLTSVRNRCLKRLRHEEVRRRMEQEDSGKPTDEEPEDERLAEVEEIVCSMSGQKQRIFRLRYTEGYTYEEIATAEGISKVAVWKHLSSVLNAIREHFNRRAL